MFTLTYDQESVNRWWNEEPSPVPKGLDIHRNLVYYAISTLVHA